ncbi:signal peptide protein [Burkholderia gladioli pv. gladioli]|uniref:hypothetical protein n=1 Tax=Burkholderia gladioli TaxID=28095 RepID=UPI001640DDE0|nr:hypothetical protein [Burkholderia gladioli]MDJ1166948.1 signal peptide protein [Burkholderia gladioli pv. gladioli]
MPILIVLFVLAALVWGAVAAFHALAAQFGTGAAIAAAVVAAALLAFAVSAWLRSRREIAPNTREGGWTHVMRQGTASLQLSSTQGLLWMSLDGVEGRYTLTDIVDCQARQVGGQWCLVVTVRDARQPEWQLPMASQREARRWARVVTLGRAGSL